MMMNAEISRVTRSKAAARQSYNRLSRWYDLLAGASERKFRLLGLRLLDAQPGERILEIGFGTGHALLALARSVGATGLVSGIDLSDGMHAIAGRRLERQGLAKQADLRVGDAASLPYADESFDALFMCFTLELFDTPEIGTVLAGCQRVLAADGRIAVVAMTLRGKTNLAQRLYAWAHEAIPNYADCRPIPLEDFLSANAFKPLEIERGSMWGLPIDAILGQKW